MPRVGEYFQDVSFILEEHPPEAFSFSEKESHVTLEEVCSELRMEPSAFTQLIQSLKNTRELVLLEGSYVLTSEMENTT